MDINRTGSTDRQSDYPDRSYTELGKRLIRRKYLTELMKNKKIKTIEKSLKRKVRYQMKKVGFDSGYFRKKETTNYEKQKIRMLHSHQRKDLLKLNRLFIETNYNKLLHFFAEGKDIVPEKIEPELEIVSSGSWQADLFRFAALTWSVPVSKGFGRRIRFLVWDNANKKLIGLIALGDPVFNQRKRDDYIGWTHHDRSERLVNMMDAYVLGAVPPYNELLCGKLVACLIRSKEVKASFLKKYGNTEGLISGKKKKPRLTAVTTSSSLGKSSVYNRLRLEGTCYFRSLGYTSGYGHFHFSEKLFAELREYLSLIDHPCANSHQFGQGPNWRLRTIRTAFKHLGIREDMLKHGIGREVLICELADNSSKVLCGINKKPAYNTLNSVKEISLLCKERWIIPRSIRKPEFKQWYRNNLTELWKI